MISKLLQLAIYNVTDNQHVVLSAIQDGVDGAGGFFYSEEEDTLDIEDDQKLLLSFLCSMDVRVLGSSANRSLLMDMIGKECVISGVGIDGFFQFGRVIDYTTGVAIAEDTVKLVAADQVDNSTVFKIVAQRRSTKAYVNGKMAGGVTASENMMAVHQLGSGSSTMLYGLTNTNGVGARSGDTVVMTYASLTASASINTEGFYLYPFVNYPVFFSIIKTPSVGTISTNNLRLLGYDVSSVETVLYTTTNPVSNIRQYAGGAVPTGNIFIAGRYDMTVLGAGTVISFKEPMIGRLNPQTYNKF
jgi:hypothetical protein